MPDPSPADFIAISTVKARYFRFLDTKQWDQFRALFSDDAELDYPTLGQFSSVDEAVAALAERLDGVVTVHHGHMPEVEILDDGSARGVFAMYDKVVPAPGRTLGGPPDLAHGRQGYGHYHDGFRRSGDGWVITSLTLTRLHREAL
jgi:hypothetical protein